ncbi:gephyrin-like molybdotransferase Glp [Citricoccus nitrophenolicus]|uniref:Molybdopterin molybdenumtransferase n=1 Tax=Citricoccus nitrophenolicus TaxID=863575 RepID=A0ABV0IE12_9MICC|nr:gephyrin-like molybdotransferase Glp [Citricoccus sp. I39-566]WMY77151.1 molybdopterin molybdotransferase MoeA [Citricoccus sp. I39-566]
MAEFRYRSVEEHRRRVLGLVPLLPAEDLPLAEAHGRTLAADAVATLDLPPWDNSAMDGYAVRSADTRDATAPSPVRLAVVGELPAGTGADPALAPGQAAAIMTGAPLPGDADAVVPVEDTAGWDPSAPTAGTATPASVGLVSPARPGSHIRRRGEDVRAGQVVATAGQPLAPQRLAALAAAGISRVSTRRVPRVVVVATGSELVAPGQPVRRGQIPDSNSLMLAALVRASGGEVVHRTRVSDDPAELRAVLARTADSSDAVILTGGASVGAHDVARLVLAPESGGGVPLEAADGTGAAAEHDAGRGVPLEPAVRFERVSVQPGKPQGFGLLPDGRPVWSLPGNPVSAWVSYLVFVEAGLLGMQGRAATTPRWYPATTVEGWRSPPRREQYVPARVVSGPGEPLRVAQATERGSGSHLAGRLARATGLVRVPAHTDEVSPGDTVHYRPLEA